MSADYTYTTHINDSDDLTPPPHDAYGALDPAPDNRNSPPPRFGFDAFLEDNNYDLAAPVHSFEEAYRDPPLPYSTGFFDHILNPAGLDHGRYSPFPWRPYSPLTHSMPPTTRARPHCSQQPTGRLPNGYVDLTSTPDSPPQRRKRESPTPGPSAKRQKREDGTKGTPSGSAAPVTVGEVDLIEDKRPVQETLHTQREDAVKAQAKPEETHTTFNTINCVICMDSPTDLTATACEFTCHLFCHTCLMEALIAGENRTGPHETKRSQCPVCRKSISRNKASDIIPLLLKKGLATQPRKKKAPSVAATGPKVS